MFDKITWYGSATLLWLITAFATVVAMAAQGLSQMFDVRNEAEILAAGGWMSLLAGATLLVVFLLPAAALRPPSRVRESCIDLAGQAIAIFLGGVIAVGYARFGVPMLVVATLAVVLSYRLPPRSEERPWLRSGAVGLAVFSAAVPIVLGSL